MFTHGHPRDGPYLALIVSRNLRFGPLARASYATPDLDTTSLPPEQTQTRSLWGPSPDNRGGLNTSLQRLLKVFLQESTRLISFAGVGSIETKPCLGSE